MNYVATGSVSGKHYEWS